LLVYTEVRTPEQFGNSLRCTKLLHEVIPKRSPLTALFVIQRLIAIRVEPNRNRFAWSDSPAAAHHPIGSARAGNFATDRTDDEVGGVE
jgi:hypothetical protein